jgi:hypothetical protein
VPRDLEKNELEVLDKLAIAIKEIVTAAGPKILEGTAVLGDPVRAGDGYGQLHQRFQRVPDRLTELRKSEKVKVDDQLPAAYKALASTSVVGEQPNVTSLAVRSELVAGVAATLDPATLTGRALTLFHELTHTLEDKNAKDDGFFLIRDFTYRDSWSEGYLPPGVGWRNADTYAEAAARIAGIQQGNPGRYQPSGPVRQQKQALMKAYEEHGPGFILGPALAWAAMKVNRIWLCSADYRIFAQNPEGIAKEAFSGFVEKVTQSASDSGVYRKEMYRVDVGLHALGLIGERGASLRSAGLKNDLNNDDIATIDAIGAYVNTLKGVLDNLIFEFAAAGPGITYNAATQVLRLPADKITGTALGLGESILGALSAGVELQKPGSEDIISSALAALTIIAKPGDNVAALNKNKSEIMTLLFVQDRPYEAGQIATVSSGLDVIRNDAPPAAEPWQALGAELALVDLRAIAADLAPPPSAQSGKPAPAPRFPAIHDYLRHKIERFARVYQTLGQGRRPEAEQALVAVTAAANKYHQAALQAKAPEADNLAGLVSNLAKLAA